MGSQEARPSFLEWLEVKCRCNRAALKTKKATPWIAVPASATVSLMVFLLYFGFRSYLVVSATIGNNKHSDYTWPRQPIASAWFFLCFELFLSLPDTLPCILRAIAFRSPFREKHFLEGDNVPHVDVLITCCNEDLDVITDTVRAACVLDYPIGRHRIFVCDDGSSVTIKRMVEQISHQHKHLFYTTRTKGPVKDYKAGNLNHGLLFSRFKTSSPSPASALSTGERLDENTSYGPPSTKSTATELRSLYQETLSSETYAPSDPLPQQYAGLVYGEFVAGLDADMIPSPNWLRSLMPYMIEDSAMAMVCPPQLFYDIPANDPLTQTMAHFAGITETIHDALGHADCLGSGYIMRRSAVEGIGGFPIQSLSEDVCCSSLLLGAGWKTAFASEPVQYGSVPESLAGHIKQRSRWFVGHIQTAKMFNLRLWGERSRHLTFKQRLVGIAFDLRHLLQVPRALTYIATPLALLTGSPLVYWTNKDQLRHVLFLLSVYRIVQWVHLGIMNVVSGTCLQTYDMRATSRDAELDQWLSPYIFIAFLRSFILPKAMGGGVFGFTPSGSISSELNERNPQSRAPLGQRLYTTLFSYLGVVHLVFVLACLAGVSLCFARAFALGDVALRSPSNYSPEGARSNLDERMIYLLTRVGWPPLFWLQQVISALAPLLYAISPPSVEPRENLLVRDPVTLVAYPKEKAKALRTTVWGHWRYARPALVITYTLMLCICVLIV